jgi:uncharacterized protein
MPDAARRVIDGFQFARGSGELHGTLALSALPRLAEMGVAASPGFEYQVRGGVSERGKPVLRIAARGRADMTCQRCLGAVEVRVEADAELELAASEAAIEAADDDVERVLATPEMDVVALIEDELILSLPMVPRHEACEPKAARGEDEAGLPFAALAGLKRKH